MKKLLIKVVSIALGLVTVIQVSKAGNESRSGQAGASELLINPWARSSGWAGANAATSRGLESIYLNVAGMSFTKKSEFIFAHTNYIVGTGIGMNAFGFSQHVGTSGTIGLAINSLNFGDIPVTTVEYPDGGIGTFRPQFTNINLAYSKEFSNSIYGGCNLKVISENIANASAKGVAIDAGIQYLTGTNEEKNNVHFGIAIKNIGPPMKYQGDGFSFRGYAPTNGYIAPNSPASAVQPNAHTMTLEQRSAQFELPSLLNIAGAYDFKFAAIHRVTAAFTFVSNSFTRNNYNMGVEYGFKTYLMVRAGYSYEPKGATGETKSLFTGPSGGVTFEVPLNKKGSTFGIDYSYRATNPFKGVHSFGVRMNI